jgi:hypothetical protein
MRKLRAAMMAAVLALGTAGPAMAQTNAGPGVAGNGAPSTTRDQHDRTPFGLIGLLVLLGVAGVVVYRGTRKGRETARDTSRYTEARDPKASPPPERG